MSDRDTDDDSDNSDRQDDYVKKERRVKTEKTEHTTPQSRKRKLDTTEHKYERRGFPPSPQYPSSPQPQFHQHVQENKPFSQVDSLPPLFGCEDEVFLG